MSESTHIRKGFGLKRDIVQWLDRDYSSALVDLLRERDYRLEVDDTRVRLAREFGFCYGVDRAVEYAYETVKRFPGKAVYLTGEIIHNPSVNDQLRAMGVVFLSGQHADPRGIAAVGAGDVVIIPAFGVPLAEMDHLARVGATLVDTTCGSVLNVWKNVERYARNGFTSVVHGKMQHEETQATCSRVSEQAGHFLVVRDLEQTELVAQAIRQGAGDDFMREFGDSCSQGFDPDIHLERIGLANQTTMLSSDSLAIQEGLRQAMLDRYGEQQMSGRFRAFETICSATQDRQDAVEALCREGVDLMLVIGGYNSSNTNHLREIASEWTRCYHIESASCLLDRDRIRHKPTAQCEETVSKDWLPAGPLTVGITAGASTPNSRVGEVAERFLELRGVKVASLLAERSAPPADPQGD